MLAGRSGRSPPPRWRRRFRGAVGSPNPRAVGPSRRRRPSPQATGPSGRRAVRPSGRRAVGPSGRRAVGSPNPQAVRPSLSAVLAGSGVGAGELRVVDRFEPGDLLALFVVLLGGDRNRTRLKSSHVAISYAVFCLKKKNRVQSTEPQS